MKQEIDFLIPCGRNSEEYAQFLINSVEQTTSSTKFRFVLGINDDYVSKEKLLKIKSHYPIKVVDCRTKGAYSYGHGQSLDALVHYVETDYFVICDCDVVFLTEEWDQLFLNNFLADEKLAAIGTEYDGSKYMNFPNVVMSMLKTQIIKQCNVSFLPAPPEKRKLTITYESSKIYGRDVGEVIDLDTGWQLCYNLKSNGYNGLTLPLRRKSAGDECIFLKEGVRGEEYLLEDKPICSHVGRSFTRSFDNPIVVSWRQNTEEWFNGKK